MTPTNAADKADARLCAALEQRVDQPLVVILELATETSPPSEPDPSSYSSPEEYHRAIREQRRAWRQREHAPTVQALRALGLGPSSGETGRVVVRGQPVVIRQALELPGVERAILNFSLEAPVLAKERLDFPATPDQKSDTMSELVYRIKQDIIQDNYYQQHFPNDGQRFLAWYLRNVYQRTPIQAKDDITDGANDKEIDAVIVDDDKRQIIIIQGKFYNSTAVDHEPLHEVLASWNYIRKLPALQENANDKLKVKIEAVSEAMNEDYDVVFELVTTGHLTAAAQRDLLVFQEAIGEYEHPEASLTLVDAAVIKVRWEEALAQELPRLNHTLTLEPGRYLSLELAHFKTVLAAIKLSECLKLPGIRDGSLFRKNVRQSLGLTNKVNKGLKQTLNGENPQFFFLYHNGITALCEGLNLDSRTNELTLTGLSVVNGCQSLNTILACSEKVKSAADAYVLFRFYEIPQRDLADKISINTNTQSAVKPRDLRSNDKRVLALKKAYEGVYRDGYFITKRGEEIPADKDAGKTIDIVQIAKCLMAWHCQRPNIAFNENRIFDKYFEQLFRTDYKPVDLLALHQWFQQIERRWKDQDLNLNEPLAAAQSYSKLHLLYAIQACFCVASNQIDKVPMPSATVNLLAGDPDPVITMAANCFNSGLDAAINEYQERGRLLSPQNWLKAKDSLLKVQAAVKMYMGMIGGMQGGAALKRSLTLPADKFALRWSAE
jgi:hypothetical protein